MPDYVVEPFSGEERALLAPHVTDMEQPVFALVGLPEVVKGALFARYSRSPRSLRRLLLDEFREELGAGGPSGGDAEREGGRAARLYERIFGEYGDDSVAQLGGAHAAVEQASNLLTKVLEWGRLGAYLEQSTRYIPYNDRPGGRWRYHRPSDVMATAHAGDYVAELDAVFAAYTGLFAPLTDWARERFPQDSTTSDAVYRSSIRAKVCDVLRGLLPAATVSNVGIFASGQAYEQMLIRLRGHELAEARQVGDALLIALRQVIPSFLTRVDRPDRGGAWTAHQASTRTATRAVATELLAGIAPDAADEVTLVDFDPDAETDLIVGILYPHSDLPETQLRRRVDAMGVEDRLRAVRAFTGQRTNRRHKPGRALERVSYRFDICSDYGAFRDLQRHRLVTIEWQDLSPRHGYVTPPEIDEAGVAEVWHATLAREAQLWDRLRPDLPVQAQYAVGLAHRLRYCIQLNARAAMQMIELRTAPQGHASYRRVCQRMHRLIAEQAGHHAVAEMMSFVDHSQHGLERLEAERVAEARRRDQAAPR
ncbi:MAG: thymidylate synthase [Nitriliruptorales bacterium]|nr:thymidylate synthase [Nitriliruptorales bacterium]